MEGRGAKSEGKNAKVIYICMYKIVGNRDGNNAKDIIYTLYIETLFRERWRLRGGRERGRGGGGETNASEKNRTW